MFPISINYSMHIYWIYLHLRNYFWQVLELRPGVSSSKQPNDGKPARRSCKASWSAVRISLHICMIVRKLIRTWLCTIVSTNIKQVADPWRTRWRSSRPTSFAATHLAATASFNNIYDKLAAAFNIVRGSRHQIHPQVGA